MKEQIYPLLFKPGIQKDGTNFQGEICTNGQWVRWQMGKVRKIGGMHVVANLLTNNKQDFLLSNLFLLQNTNNIYIYFAYYYKIYFGILNNQNIVSDQKLLELNIPNNRFFTVFEPVVITTYNEEGSVKLSEESWLLMLFIPTSVSNQEIKPYLLARPLYSQETDGNTNHSDLVQNGADGGMLYIAPYLFFYGSNGIIKYSRADRSKVFEPDKYTAINVGNGEKIIYAAAWRGNQSPTLIVWTASSVIRILNIAGLDATEPLFKIDPSLFTTSILSNRSVVQYDNVFEWVGTDGFYMYNGAVSKIENNMVFNYFYDNLDLSKRDQVFAVQNKKYDEIWYFYPSKDSKDGLNDKVIIHNHANSNNPKDWFWYNSDISRQAGFYNRYNGKMYSFGFKFNYTEDDKVNAIWVHETGINETSKINNRSFDNPITSYFTTPTFSFASFSPLKQFIGANNFITIKSFEPDFVYEKDVDFKMSLEVLGRKYAMQPLTLKSTHEINRSILEKGKIDILTEARQMSLKFTSTDFFQLGNCFMLLGIGDGQ